MKHERDEITYRVLVLLRLDSNSLFNRIVKREKEYLHTFSLHRTRGHFPDIFENRYKNVKLETLKDLPEEILVALDSFYGIIDDIYWYLKHTEDMGNTVQDKIERHLHKLRDAYNILNIHLDAELKGEKLDDEDLNDLKSHQESLISHGDIV